MSAPRPLSLAFTSDDFRLPRAVRVVAMAGHEPRDAPPIIDLDAALNRNEK